MEAGRQRGQPVPCKDAIVKEEEEQSESEEEGREMSQFLCIVGVNSWQTLALKKVPALAVLVGFTDVTPAEELAKMMSACGKAMFVTDARGIGPGGKQIDRRPVDRQTMPHAAGPPCWPFVAANKTVCTSCALVDRVVWHKVDADPVECL